MSLQIPEGMTLIQAFEALYTNARVIGMGKFVPLSGDTLPDKLAEVMKIFQAHCPKHYCDYVRGKCMKVHFGDFPLVNGQLYDREYGAGAAQRAIDSFDFPGKAKQVVSSLSPSLPQLFGAVVGTVALYKTVQNLRAEGKINMRGLAWAAVSVAAIAIPYFIKPN